MLLLGEVGDQCRRGNSVHTTWRQWGCGGCRSKLVWLQWREGTWVSPCRRTASLQDHLLWGQVAGRQVAARPLPWDAEPRNRTREGPPHGIRMALRGHCRFTAARGRGLLEATLSAPVEVSHGHPHPGPGPSCCSPALCSVPVPQSPSSQRSLGPEHCQGSRSSEFRPGSPETHVAGCG